MVFIAQCIRVYRRHTAIFLTDGKVLRGAGRKRRHWTLQLRDARKEDSGRYTCKVYNRVGAINFTYTVNIVGEQIFRNERKLHVYNKKFLPGVFVIII